MSETPIPSAPLTAADFMTRDVVTVPQQIPAAVTWSVVIERSISYARASQGLHVHQRYGGDGN